MAEPTNDTAYKPFVPQTVSMSEFTLRAVIPGLIMTLVLGAANAYLGLRAGQTIAATYPAAVISMAILRIRKGSILEENLARTAGSIGESVAAGAIFTIPAFLIAGVWPSFAPEDAYWKSTALMIVGGILGVLFCSLPRIGCRSRNPQGGPGRRSSRKTPLRQHGGRCRSISCRRIQVFLPG